MMDRIDELAEIAALHRPRYLVSEAMQWCDSPLEQAFLLEMLCDNYRFVDASYSADATLRLIRARGYLFDSRSIVAVQGEMQLDDRDVRIDFAIFSRSGGRIAVELDGHEFHERTKEQAARDRSRDRLLTAIGWRVIRFTGSEVYRLQHHQLLQPVWDVERRIVLERSGAAA